MPPLHPLPPCHRHLTPPSPFSAFPSSFNASATTSTPLHYSLMHLHRHLNYFIRPLTPSHRPLTSLRRHLTLIPTYKCLYITLQRPPLTHYPFKPSRCIKASFYIPKNRLNFPTTKGFRTKISMKLVCQYMTLFLYFSTHFKSSSSTTRRELRQQFVACSR